MRSALLISTAAMLVLSAGPASAELRDIIAETDGATGRIWLAFDAQPAAVDVQAGGAALELRIEGVSSAERLISPSDRSLVDAVRLSGDGNGAVTVRLQGHGGWQDAQAEIRRGGILVTLDLDEAVTVADAAPGAAAREETHAPTHGPTHGDAAASADASAGDAESRETPRSASTSGHAGDDGAPDGAGASQTGEDEAAPPAAEDPSAAPAAQDSASAARPGPRGTAGSGDCSEEAEAVAENPWDDDSLHRHAACLTGAGELEAAAIIYEQMLAFAPDDFRALIALAEVRAEQGENAAARELYSQAASFAISDAEAARARARLRELQQR